MYYEEKIINGVLCHRTSPDGKWFPFSIEQLSERVQSLKIQVQQLTAPTGREGE